MHSVIKCLLGSICQYSRLLEHESKLIEAPYQNHSIIGASLSTSQAHGVLDGSISIDCHAVLFLYEVAQAKKKKKKKNYNLEKNN